MTSLILWLECHGTALGATFAGFSAILAAISLWRNHRWNSKKAAMDAIVALAEFTDDTDDIAAYFRGDFDKPQIPKASIEKALSNKPEIIIKIKRVLDHYENLATGINQGVFAAGVIKNARRTDIRTTFNKYHWYIEIAREDHSTAYNHLEELADKWK